MTVKYIDIHAHAYRCPMPFVVLFCAAEELARRCDEAGIETGGCSRLSVPKFMEI
ncbi:MAG: hypothetical protein GX280_03985 [Lentisphaerae bacterium]|nr:hypothetical protein [Lentisphaerota bacterium]